MEKLQILSPTENLVDKLVALLTGDGAELSRALIVFPGKRPSHFVRKALARRLNASFIPPRIFAYDEFMTFLSREKLGMNKRVLDPLDASSLLFDIHSQLSERLGGNHFTSFDQFLPLGFKLFEELEDLLLADVNQSRIDEKIGGLSFGNRHLIARYYKDFYAAVEQRGAATASTVLRLVADRFPEMTFDEFDRMILAGFFALTPVDRRIFNHFRNLDQTFFLFQQGRGLPEQLKNLIGTGPQEPPPLRVQTPLGPQMDLFGSPTPSDSHVPESQAYDLTADIHLYRAPDTHGQVLALSARMKELLDSGVPLDEKTVIVLPSSDALFPVLHQTLALLPSDGYNISLGYPLARTPLYGFLSALLDLVTSEQNGLIPSASYMSFVLHPYVKNLRFGPRSDVTRVLFHAIEEVLAKRPSGSVSLEEVESLTAVYERVARGLSDDRINVSQTKLRAHLAEIHEKTIKPFLKVETLEEFARKITDLILYVHDQSTAHLHPLFPRYAEHLLEIVDGVGKSLAARRRFADRAGYATFLRSYVGPHTVPFPGTPLRGVQVLGLLETRNLSFDRVFVLDMSDDVLPGASSAEMLVPQNVREALGLETARQREDLLEYHFRLLLAGAKDVHLFFTENPKRERSRFIEKMIWEKERSAGEVGGRESKLVQYRIHLANADPQPIHKPDGVVEYLREFEFSATALDEYLKCPIRFYYRYVQGLREKEEVGEEIEQLEIGNLVHTILKRYFEPLVGKPLTATDLDKQRMTEVTRKVLVEMYGPNPRGAAYLLRRQTEERMEEFLDLYQQKVIEKEMVEIANVEQLVSVVKNGHHFGGRIDRVEKRNGKTFILDYKIRADDSPYKISVKKLNVELRETWPEAIGSLQLPLYALLYSEQYGEPAGNIVPLYVLLGRNYVDTSIEAGLPRDARYPTLERVILELAEEIKDPAIPFFPTADQKKQCPKCPYQTICGTQWAKEGRW